MALGIRWSALDEKVWIHLRSPSPSLLTAIPWTNKQTSQYPDVDTDCQIKWWIHIPCGGITHKIYNLWDSLEWTSVNFWGIISNIGFPWVGNGKQSQLLLVCDVISGVHDFNGWVAKCSTNWLTTKFNWMNLINVSSSWECMLEEKKSKLIPRKKNQISDIDQWVNYDDESLALCDI